MRLFVFVAPTVIEVSASSSAGSATPSSSASVARRDPGRYLAQLMHGECRFTLG